MVEKSVEKQKGCSIYDAFNAASVVQILKYECMLPAFVLADFSQHMPAIFSYCLYNTLNFNYRTKILQL